MHKKYVLCFNAALAVHSIKAKPHFTQKVVIRILCFSFLCGTQKEKFWLVALFHATTMKGD